MQLMQVRGTHLEEQLAVTSRSRMLFSRAADATTELIVIISQNIASFVIFSFHFSSPSRPKIDQKI